MDFAAALRNPRGNEDVILQEGDIISIPRKPNAVAVNGEVGNPGLLGYIKGDKLWKYVERGGGLTDSSLYVYLMYPSGAVEKYSTGWLARRFESNPEVLDGSSIRVTRARHEAEAEPFDLGGTIKDVFAIVASTVTILVLASQIK